MKDLRYGEYDDKPFRFDWTRRAKAFALFADGEKLVASGSRAAEIELNSVPISKSDMVSTPDENCSLGESTPSGNTDKPLAKYLWTAATWS